MSSEIGDLFVTLRAVTDPYTAPMAESATIGEEATGRIIAAGEQMAASLAASAEQAATAFRTILDSVLQLAEGIVEPLATVKTAIRGVASAARALGKAAVGLGESAKPAFESISAAGQQMATGLDASLASAKASFAGLDAEFGTAAAAATAAATEMTAAGTEGAAAATEAGDAAAVSAGKSSAALDGTAGSLSKYVIGLAAAGVGVFEAVKGATSFQAELTKINTQANVSQGQLASLGNGVLNLAGQVGFAPDSLAEALFHVESSFASTGITGQRALDILKTAAEGAAVGHANLVDVQNALDAAIASGIPGVENYQQAMGALNSIVGAGDMSMQDLANAMSSGVLAVVKGYGLSLTDVGAALATFGDNNIRGAAAATDVRMAVQGLAVPAKDGKALLEQWGQSASSLATDMQNHGLVYTLNQLHDLFVKNGVTATEQGAVITDMFGKKAGAGLSVLMGQLDRVNSKVPDITAGAKGFAGSWQTTSHTVGQEFNSLKASLESLGVRIGTMLLPPLSKVLGWIREGIVWVTSHKAAMQALAVVLGGVLLTAVVSIAGAVLAMEAPFTLAEVAIAAVGAAVFYAYTHFKTFRTIVNDIGTFLKGAFKVAWAAAGAVIDWFRTTVIPGARKAIADLVAWWNAHKAEFSEAWKLVMQDVQTVVHWFDDNVIKWVQARVAELVTWWKAHSAEISQVWNVTWKVAGDAVQTVWGGVIKPVLETIAGFWNLTWGLIKDTFKLTWSILSDAVTTGMHLIENIIGVILDVVTGHWGQAWKDLKKLVSDGFNDVTKFLGDLTSNFGTLLLDAGKNLIDGLIKGIKAGAGGISSAVSGVAKTVRDFFPFSPAKTGPLSGSGSMDLAGAKVGSMLADGMHSSVGTVARAATRLAGVAAGAGGAGLAGNASSPYLAVGGGSAPYLAAQGGGPLGGGAGALGATAATAPTIVVNVNVEGSVLSDNNLRDVVERQMLRIGMRNSTTWQPYARR